VTAIVLVSVGLSGVVILWPFMGITLWLLLIALVVVLLRGVRTTGGDSGGGPVRVLEERYARGEITREEFLERRAVLGGSTTGATADEER
jgi:putative membrane protein